MERTINIIKANIEKHPHFDEYFKIITIIQDNELVNPDICIESCKALIEGISKTFIVNLDNTKTPENIDDDNLPKLFKEAINILSLNCRDIEADFVLRFSGIIQVLGEIRNKRGDISHGRMAPKAIYSSKKFATTVKSMTDTMLEYTLDHYFDLDLNFKEKLDYNAPEMESYNYWLDESVDFPIAKARYSKILFEHDPDEYEGRYFDEFLKSPEENEVVDKEEIIVDKEFEERDEVKTVDESLETEKETLQPEHKAEISLSELLEQALKKTPALTEQESKQLYEATFGKKEEPKPIVQLINTFDETTFWTENRIQLLNQFAEAENLNLEKSKKLIEDFLFSDKPPFRDDVADSMNEKPNLKERGKITEEMTEKIIAFATELKN